MPEDIVALNRRTGNKRVDRAIKSVVGFLLSALLFVFHAQSQAPPKFLLGHRQNELELVGKSDAIFVGEFLSPGIGPSSDAAGESDFDGAKVRVGQVLKGPLTCVVTASYGVESILEKEEMPQMNKSYIFFAVTEPWGCEVMKLMLPTKENIAEVKELIASDTARQAHRLF